MMSLLIACGAVKREMTGKYIGTYHWDTRSDRTIKLSLNKDSTFSIHCKRSSVMPLKPTYTGTWHDLGDGYITLNYNPLHISQLLQQYQDIDIEQTVIKISTKNRLKFGKRAVLKRYKE